jgi:hypothetical protein
VGIESIAQVDLDVRQNQHQPLSDLGPMASAVLSGITSRMEQDGRLTAAGRTSFLAPTGHGFVERGMDRIERPPVATLASVA